MAQIKTTPETRWRPSKRQIELLAECMVARLGTAETARQLGVSEARFVAWAARIDYRRLLEL